jgi:hypothetical protein
MISMARGCDIYPAAAERVTGLPSSAFAFVAARKGRTVLNQAGALPNPLRCSKR